jgi:hypothetical protein
VTCNNSRIVGSGVYYAVLVEATGVNLELLVRKVLASEARNRWLQKHRKVCRWKQLSGNVNENTVCDSDL